MTHYTLWLRLCSALILASLVAASVQAAQPSRNGFGSSNPVDPDGKLGSAAKPAKPQVAPDANVRVIIRLMDAPLASYVGGIDGLKAASPVATGKARLDVSSPESQSYLSYLASVQEEFRNRLAQTLPEARVQREYRLAFNGFAVRVPVEKIRALRQMDGVAAVTLEREYHLDMDESLPLIGLGSGTLGGTWTDSGLWSAVGGHANAGAGIKIADVDSGITIGHPCFDGTGYTYPSGFPKYDPGYAGFVNGKVIAARAYFRPNDPPVLPGTPADDPSADLAGGHGTHTAGTMVCNYGTQSPYSGLKISGVAPKAYLMVYRVFYRSLSGSNSASDPELLAAIEDAIADGADVVNNSWGSTALTTVADDPLVQAYGAAVDAGLVVVFSNGNAGPGAATVSSPATGPKVISVGATTTSRTFTATVSATSTTSPTLTIPVTVTNMIARSLVTQTVSAQTIDLAAQGYADSLACPAADGGLGPLPSSLASGRIVVVQRGVCALVDKVANAAAGGAVGVIIRNVASGATTLPLINPVLPTAHVLQADGDNLFNWLSSLKTQGITATFTITGPAMLDYSNLEDTVASFSSRGPTPEMDLKPDISAPGVNLLSSVSYGNLFDFFEGTSMAAPHVTGATALLKQLHPDWTPAQIKSALMSTAVQPAALGTNPTNRGAGRLNLGDPEATNVGSPTDPGLTFDNPSLSFGLITVGQVAIKTVTAKDVTGLGGVYTVTAVASSGAFTPTVPMTISVPASGTTTFDVVLTAGATGDAFGNINLTDGTVTHTLHIPYWVRRIADLGPADVFLIDDDNSTSGLCANDFLGIYTQTLTNLGKSYVIWDVDANGFNIDFNQLRRYSKVIYFTGDMGCGGDLSFFPTSLRNYLANGGRMLITGQDIGFWDDFYLTNFGASFNPQLFFGAGYVQDNLYSASTPVPAVVGDNAFSSYLAGQSYDLRTTTGDGAHNQTSVDEIVAQFYTDVDALPILTTSAVTTTLELGHLGTRMSSEPTIERVKGEELWTHLGYQTELLSFGLEGVNNNTGFNTREELLDRLLAWLDDTVTVSFNAPSYFVSATNTTLTVTASTSVTTTTTGLVNDIVLYRWDFGDGTPIQTTSTPSAVHGYTNDTYTAYVEAQDAFGHRAVAHVTVQASIRLYLPLVAK